VAMTWRRLLVRAEGVRCWDMPRAVQGAAVTASRRRAGGVAGRPRARGKGVGCASFARTKRGQRRRRGATGGHRRRASAEKAVGTR
jgi:hypothetical protein